MEKMQAWKESCMVHRTMINDDDIYRNVTDAELETSQTWTILFIFNNKIYHYISK